VRIAQVLGDARWTTVLAEAEAAVWPEGNRQLRLFQIRLRCRRVKMVGETGFEAGEAGFANQLMASHFSTFHP
jgi:hypothetical protein